jgi:hypothetical protein
MQTKSPESDVLDVFEKLRTAMLCNDIETLDRHVDPSYRGSDAGGRVHGRAEYLAAYGPGGVELKVFEVSDLETQAWPGTVLVSGIVELRGSYREKPFEHRSRFLDVYRRLDASWMLVASSVTDLA